MRKLIIFDVDGTLVWMVDDSRGPRNLGELQILPGVVEACAELRAAGWDLVMVSNQPDVGRKLVLPHEIAEVHRHVCGEIAALWCYVCPHTPEDRCACRKPRPGMLYMAMSEYDGVPEQCVMVGDSDCDSAAAMWAGVIFCRVETNEGIGRVPGWISENCG